MSDRKDEFRVGVVALATVAIVVLLVALNTGTSLSIGGSPYEIAIRVDRAPGVGPNTPVRKDGVLIGRVVSTDFLPDGGVMVRANIQRQAPIYQTDACRIQPSSLFGDAVINFVYAGGVLDPSPLVEGDTVNGSALPDPIEAITSLQVEVGPAVASIADAAEGVAVLTDRLNQALGEGGFDVDGVDSLVVRATQAMDQFGATMQQMQSTIDSINVIVGDPQIREGLRQSASDLPNLLADTRDTVTTATETLNALGGVVERAGTNLRNLEGLTEPLGDRGAEIAQSLLTAVDNLNEALVDVQQFTDTLNDSEGTVSRLVQDRTIADNLETTIANANAVIVHANDVLKELRPILYDVRVFSDKIAREPGRLIGGAVNRGPGLK